MKLQAFISLVGRDNQRLPGAHILHPPALESDLADWHDLNRDFQLPDEWVEFYKWSNGLGVWCQRIRGEYISHGYVFFFPLSQLEKASMAMYGEHDEDYMPSTYLALATEQDGQWFLVLDTATGQYIKIPPIGSEETKVVALNFSECLDWLVNTEKLVGHELPDVD